MNDQLQTAATADDAAFEAFMAELLHELSTTRAPTALFALPRLVPMQPECAEA